MADLLKFVDSIVASPTTRLDLNDGTIWRVTAFDAPPPRLRRSMSQNAMTDGGFVSSSQYEMRTVKMTLFLTRSTEDLNATQLQTLSRELDRADNYLMYQPSGASKPVFFRTVRSDFTAVRDLAQVGTTSSRVIEVELLAEPFALGLRETLGPYTVNNDPAAGSNGHYFDVTGVIGDVDAPCLISDSTAGFTSGWLAVRQHGTPSDAGSVMFIQAESCTLAIPDTTNPGGGPDAVMSGSGTNNFRRTSFATSAAMSTRLRRTLTLSDAEGVASRGTYRVLAVVRRSDNTSVMTAEAIASTNGNNGVASSTVTIPQSTSRQVIDLGLVTIGAPVARVGLLNSVEIPTVDVNLDFRAARASGTGTLDWDYFVAVPADEAQLAFYPGEDPTPTGVLMVDGLSEDIYWTESGVSPFLSTSSVEYWGSRVAGGFPSLRPNQTNRFVCVMSDLTAAPYLIDVTDTATISVNYWPRYLYVRPSAT